MYTKVYKFKPSKVKLKILHFSEIMEQCNYERKVINHSPKIRNSPVFEGQNQNVLKNQMCDNALSY